MELTHKEQTLLQALRKSLIDQEKITIRGLQVALGYASPRSISVLLEKLIDKWYVYRDSREELRLRPNFQTESQEVRRIPLIGTIACGMPIFAEENIETEIEISTKIAKSHEKYFFLRADGDSMNRKEILPGDLVLIRETNIAKNGDIVVALINDEATLKEYRYEGHSIYLIPHSDNPRHKPIILDAGEETLLIQWVFVRSFPGNLFT